MDCQRRPREIRRRLYLRGLIFRIAQMERKVLFSRNSNHAQALKVIHMRTKLEGKHLINVGS
jgi:hypothetical protein